MSAAASPWDRYHRGKLLLWGGFALYLPVVAVAGLLLGGDDNVVVWVAATWLVLWTINGQWLARFRCPRCGGRFFRVSRFVGNLWATRCCQCGTRPPPA